MPSTFPAIEARIHQDTLADVLQDAAKLILRGGLAAFGCGIVAGLASAPACFGSAVPLILAAEAFETPCDSAIESCHEDHLAFTPADGAERTVCTLTSNIWIGVAYASLLLGGLLVRGSRLGHSEGLQLALVGFASVQLLPALGLSPELPGMLAAGVQIRQIWHSGQIAAGLFGAWLILGELPRQWAHKMLGRAATVTTTSLGVLLGIMPLLVGAPHAPHDELSRVPAELAARFACSSLLTTFCFWLTLGPACAFAAGKVDSALLPDSEATEALGKTSSSATHLVADEAAGALRSSPTTAGAGVLRV